MYAYDDANTESVNWYKATMNEFFNFLRLLYIYRIDNG